MSDLPTHKLRNLPVRKLIRALVKDGFLLDHQKGSHRVYYNKKGIRVVVPFHGANKTLPIKTLSAIILDAGWTPEDLKRLKLIS